MEQKLCEKELSDRLAKAATLVSVGSTYTHYKNKHYIVRNLAIIEADNDVCVIYQAQYGERLTFIRPVADWIEDVEWENKKLKRFTKTQ